MKFSLNFYTSYNQFYINDQGSNGDTASETFWTAEAYNDRLAIADGIIGIGTECYGPVKGEITILNSVNDNIDIDDYEHIVEGSVEIKSGILQIVSCPNSIIELEVSITPGFYRVRVYSLNLSSVVGDEGEDYYKIEIWPHKKMERRVLKNYIG